MKIRVEELFHAVADLPDEDRSRYFAEHGIGGNTRKEVEALVAYDSPATTSLESDIGRVAIGALARVEPQQLPCGPYRLGSLLGRGGMGTVYAAERADGEVSQRVAVKLLRPGADDPLLRQRFLMERQILAGLSHPNIARLLDAGHRKDGQPYLVMEQIEGTPIDVYVADLSVRRKVRLFLKVCAAVSYLHRNLVVHRDLKPANILVNEDGEPKLLDFGIAKMLDLSTSSTATSMRILTPDYGSPEQVGGGPLTTATDIYSLGAVLYKLLTGSSPHQFAGDSPGAIAWAISSGRITPPSKLAADLSGDLEIVILKALRTEPQDRYATVDAFADDLRNCLEWRPVEARSGDRWYRARRLLRHYWLPAATAAVVIASLSTGLYVANRQRVIAERRFAQLRQLSNRVIDLDGAMRTLPGSVEARRRLVAASLEYLEGLSREARGNLDLAEEISDGYWRMARIQGVNAEFNLGDKPRAEENLKKADALVQTVLASRPHDRGALFRAAVIAVDRVIVTDNERHSEMMARLQTATDRVDAFMLHDDPANPVRLEGYLLPGDAWQSERRGVATLYQNVALGFVNQHHFDEGERYARRAVEIGQPIPAAQEVTAGALSVLANALRYQGDLEGALSTIHQARKLSEQAVFPNEAARMFSAYALGLREGRILGEEDAVNLGRPAEAIEVLQKAMDVTDGVARKDPRDSASRNRLGTVARELGDILSDRDPRRALAVFDLGIQRLSEVQTNVSVRRERAGLLAKSAHALRILHRVPEAQARIDEALAVFKDLKEYPVERIRLGGAAYSLLCALADHKADTGEVPQAIEIYQNLIHKSFESGAKPESSLPDATRLSHVYAASARLNRAIGRNDAAAGLESRRMEMWRRWDARLPGNSFIHRQLNMEATR